jgi:transposase
MTYPLSFRKKVISLVHQGRKKLEIAQLFGISPDTLYCWLNADNLAPKSSVPRQRKINKEALRAHVLENPDHLLRERAAHFPASGGQARYGSA